MRYFGIVMLYFCLIIQKLDIMVKVDYIEEISTSVIFKDTLGFHHILQELKKIDSFEGH